jgi:hypothetical protein
VTGHDLVSQDLLGHIGSTLRRRRELAGLTHSNRSTATSTTSSPP